MATSQSTPISDEIKDTLQRFSVFLLTRCGTSMATRELWVGFMRRTLPHIGTNPTHEVIERYLADYRLSGESYGNVCNLITALMRYSDFIGNPIILKRPKKPRRILINVLSEADVVRIIASAKTLRERAILSVLAYSGCRNRELCGLLVRDVDAASGIIAIEQAKGELHRKVCIAPACAETLTEYLRERNGRPDERLFVTVRHGYELEPQDLRKIIRIAAKRAGIKKRVHPHLFRHSLATNMLHRGAGLLTIKEQLGHNFIESTMLYLHASKERLQADYRQFVPSYM